MCSRGLWLGANASVWWLRRACMRTDMSIQQWSMCSVRYLVGPTVNQEILLYIFRVPIYLISLYLLLIYIHLKFTSLQVTYVSDNLIFFMMLLKKRWHGSERSRKKKNNTAPWWFEKPKKLFGAKGGSWRLKKMETTVYQSNIKKNIAGKVYLNTG